ncbi:hypothetical protein L1987_66341 [Smallanthus sonchifolius]|uniref:Uncharacterized protein n=1 Tax=Smallanthus sonchifolius TaxID=185202 RepID=A0ACB9BX62_9ASTR|nr:hypothetical protein L1987_66341 [Smallanthus sonchifolius]
MSMAVPITAMNCLVFLRAVVSVLFLGRLGSLELDGGSLSLGFTNITGYSVLVGLASGLEPVCSQAYGSNGSNKWELLSASLVRMVFILLMAVIPISLFWLNLEPIMLLMGHDATITSMAATYCIYSLPDLLTNCLLQPLRDLRSQGVTKPMMWCSLIGVAFHVPLNYVLVVGVGLGVGRGGNGFGGDEFEYGGVDDWVRVGVWEVEVDVEMDEWDWNGGVGEIVCDELYGNMFGVVVV